MPDTPEERDTEEMQRIVAATVRECWETYAMQFGEGTSPTPEALDAILARATVPIVAQLEKVPPEDVPELAALVVTMMLGAFLDVTAHQLIGHIEGYYYKPRIDVEALRLHKDGLVVTSACAGGVISAHLAAGNDSEAYEAAAIYKEIFGEDFYVEIQNHGIDREAIVREKAPGLARELDGEEEVARAVDEVDWDAAGALEIAERRVRRVQHGT